MCDLFIFSDEAGDFTFERKPNVSKYFIFCTVAMRDLEACLALADLRRELVWRRANGLGEYFHATTDSQEVRDAVFEIIKRFDFTIQATICEKSKAQPQVRVSKSRFYKYPMYYHFKHGMLPIISAAEKVYITAAAIGTKKERKTYISNIEDVMQQNIPHRVEWAIDFRRSMADTGLQIADYCAWAIQRKWERGDTRSYNIIKNKITYEYDLWRRGDKHYY